MSTRKRTPEPVTPVKVDSRICFALAYFESAEDADTYAQFVRKRGDTYNGGFYDGILCGREKAFDHYDRERKQKLYAVSTR